MPPIDALHMSDADTRAACHAWEMGGSMGLGQWLGQYKPHFNVRDYADLVALVREELGDDTDYSRAA